MAGVMVMADVVAPPSGSEPESSRRARPDVTQEEEKELALSGSKSDGFGPVVTTGEPFHQDVFGPVITTGEPFHQDSGRKRGNNDDDVSSSSRSTPTTTIQLTNSGQKRTLSIFVSFFRPPARPGLNLLQFMKIPTFNCFKTQAKTSISQNRHDDKKCFA